MAWNLSICLSLTTNTTNFAIILTIVDYWGLADQTARAVTTCGGVEAIHLVINHENSYWEKLAMSKYITKATQLVGIN